MRTGLGGVEQRRLLARPAQRSLARRAPALSGVSVSELHAPGARRRRRDVRVPEEPGAGRQAEPAARASLSVRPAGGARGLARALLSAGPLRDRRGEIAAVEPRRLPGRDARSLQRLPLAPQRVRRDRRPARPRRRPDPDPELVRALAHGQRRGRRRRLVRSARSSALLKSGVSARGSVQGPMAEVVARSTAIPERRRSRGDGRATCGACRTPERPRRVDRVDSARRRPCASARGAKLYTTHCAACHGERGRRRRRRLSGAGRQPRGHDLAAGQPRPHRPARRLRADDRRAIRARSACRRSRRCYRTSDVADVLSSLRASWGHRAARRCRRST